MSFLWTTEDLIAATGGRPLGSLPDGVSGVSIDTRTLQRDEAFFAIKGERFDGHDFATAAMAAGAGLLVVSEAKLPAMGRLAMPMVVVPDVLEALEGLGRAARARTKARIIAVTGSVGKTTTKDMLRHALSAAGKVHAADRSFNNHWGVPLTLARMPADCDYAVYEIGMNHPGEIRSLVKQVSPHVAVVTLIAAAHLGHFKNLEEIAQAKAEIFEGVARGGHALINRDDQRWKTLSKLAGEAGVKNIWGFGENARAQVRLVDCALDGESSTLTIKIAGREQTVRLGAPGRHMAQNALAVIGAAHLAGADLDKVLPALSEVQPGRGRGQRRRLRHPEGAFTLIDESYNANPASMRAAIDLLGATPVAGGGRRIAVLGDMLELGMHAEKAHAGLAGPLAEAKVDRVLLAGPEMKSLAAALPEGYPVHHHEDADALKTALLATIGPGDAVMIKSSNGVGFSKLVDALTETYPAAAEETTGA